jgi:hypothetical protein
MGKWFYLVQLIAAIIIVYTPATAWYHLFIFSSKNDLAVHPGNRQIKK